MQTRGKINKNGAGRKSSPKNVGRGTERENRINWPALVFAILICEMAGAIGSIFTVDAVGGWYAALQKPFFTPPAWVFMPVWIILYAVMGIAAYIVWRKGMHKPNVQHALIFFVLQLIVNVKWSLLFFGMHSPILALIAIIVLLALICVTAFKFYRIDERAGYLFIPYIAWVIFAMLLNATIWQLNA